MSVWPVASHFAFCGIKLQCEQQHTFCVHILYAEVHRRHIQYQFPVPSAIFTCDSDIAVQLAFLSIFTCIVSWGRPLRSQSHHACRNYFIIYYDDIHIHEPSSSWLTSIAFFHRIFITIACVRLSRRDYIMTFMGKAKSVQSSFSRWGCRNCDGIIVIIKLLLLFRSPLRLCECK